MGGGQWSGDRWGAVQFFLVMLTGLEAGGSLVPHTQLPDCR